VTKLENVHCYGAFAPLQIPVTGLQSMNRKYYTAAI